MVATDMYLARSLDRCEQQLAAEPFAEPLDAAQVRRLTSIEALLGELGDGGRMPGPAGSSAAQRIAAIRRSVEPWVGRKNAVVAAAASAASRHRQDDTGDGSDAGEEGDAASQGHAEGVAGVWPTQARRHEEQQGFMAKREELLGEAEGLRRRGVVPGGAEGAERLLRSQQDTHGDLTSELAQMAGVLKKNTQALGGLVEGERGLVEETATLLDRSVTGVGSQGGRVDRFRKRSWGTTGMTWLALVVVVAVFLTLVLFMKAAPKRY